MWNVGFGRMISGFSSGLGLDVAFGNDTFSAVKFSYDFVQYWGVARWPVSHEISYSLFGEWIF